MVPYTIRKEQGKEFPMLWSGLNSPEKCGRLGSTVMPQKGLWCMRPRKQKQPKVKRKLLEHADV